MQSELSYGLAIGSAALTPYVGLSGSPSGSASRTWRLGSRMRFEPGLTVSLEAIRREQAPALPLHTLSVEGSLLY